MKIQSYSILIALCCSFYSAAYAMQQQDQTEQQKSNKSSQQSHYNITQHVPLVCGHRFTCSMVFPEYDTYDYNAKITKK